MALANIALTHFLPIAPFLARSLGFFFFSPLLSAKAISPLIKIGLALATSLLLFPSLLTTQHLVAGPLQIVGEGIFGYLLGFLLSLLFESIALAGETIGTMMGLSLTELFSPLDNLPSPFMSRIFLLFATLLVFALDLHHLFLRFLFDSFDLLPQASYPFTSQTIPDILTATTLLFRHMLQMALIPFCALFLSIVLLAITGRLFPHFPLLWIGIPLQLLVGLIVLALNFDSLGDAIKNAVVDFKEIVSRILVDLSPSV